MLKSSYSLTRKLQTKTKQTIIDSDYVTIQITAKDLTAAEAYCHHVHHSLSPCPSFTVTKVHHSLSIIHCHHCPSFTVITVHHCPNSIIHCHHVHHCPNVHHSLSPLSIIHCHHVHHSLSPLSIIQTQNSVQIVSHFIRYKLRANNC